MPNDPTEPADLKKHALKWLSLAVTGILTGLLSILTYAASQSKYSLYLWVISGLALLSIALGILTAYYYGQLHPKKSEDEYTLKDGVWLDTKGNPFCPDCDKPMMYRETGLNGNFRPHLHCMQGHEVYLKDKNGTYVDFDTWKKS